MDTTFLTIMITLTVAFMGLFVYGAAKSVEGCLATGIFGLFLTGLLGWGLFGTATIKKTHTLLNRNQYEIAKAPSFVVFSYKGVDDLRTDSYPVVLNAEGTKLYLQRNFDHYGIENKPVLVINP